MLTRDAVDRIRAFEGGTYPVLSLYLGVVPGDQRSMPARVKDLIAGLNNRNGLTREAEMSLRRDIDHLLSSVDRFEPETGQGLAIFLSGGHGLDEHIALPDRVRDRAVVDFAPYVRPLDAMLEYFKRYLVVVMERRKASFFEYHMGRLSAGGSLEEEEIRKANYAGFAGYEEQRVRSHTDEVAHRHYRDTAAEVYERFKADAFDRVVVGGVADHADGLISELHADLSGRVAGTFTIDPHALSQRALLERVTPVIAAFEEQAEQDSVSRLVDTAASGGPAVMGVRQTLNAVNQRAVDTLFIQASDSQPGTRCGDCGWLAVEGRGLCSVCGEALREVPDVLDAMAESVRAAGGSVRNILAETELTDEHVGAMLRFPLRVTIS